MNAGAAYANGVGVLSSAAAAETARNRLTTISEDEDVFISLLRQSVALDAGMAAALSHRTDHSARRPRHILRRLRPHEPAPRSHVTMVAGDEARPGGGRPASAERGRGPAPRCGHARARPWLAGPPQQPCRRARGARRARGGSVGARARPDRGVSSVPRGPGPA